MQNQGDNDDKADKDFDGYDKTGAAELVSPVLPPRPECPQHKLNTRGGRWEMHSALQQHYCHITHLLTLTNTYRHKKGQLRSHEWCKVEDHQESAGSLAGIDSTWAGSGWQRHLHHTKDHKVCRQLSWQPHGHQSILHLDPKVQIMSKCTQVPRSGSVNLTSLNANDSIENSRSIDTMQGWTCIWRHEFEESSAVYINDKVRVHFDQQ